MNKSNPFETMPTARKHKLNVLPPNPEEKREGAVVGLGRFPSWLHRKLPEGNALWATSQVLSENRLHTVCEESKCPNLLECWSHHTATFLIMGKQCTRSCGFCDIDHAKKPLSLQADEPERVAHSVKQLGLEHVVITMVARDDLPDGGAGHIALVIQKIRETVENATIEVLTSDFQGRFQDLDVVLAQCPNIFNHNIETVREYSSKVRHKATYDRSLSVLQHAKTHAVNPYQYIKSGMMLGFGESEEQVKETIRDLAAVGCDIITIGQYLQPNRHKLLVKAFIHPTQFEKYADYGYSLGIKHMYCGPFVRSSYNANLVIQQLNHKTKTLHTT